MFPHCNLSVSVLLKLSHRELPSWCSPHPFHSPSSLIPPSVSPFLFLICSLKAALPRCVCGNAYSCFLDYWQNKLTGSRSFPVGGVALSYRGSEVDGHQRMRTQEEVVESHGVLELWKDVSVPGDEPRKCKDGANLRSEKKRQTKTRSAAAFIYSIWVFINQTTALVSF